MTGYVRDQLANGWLVKSRKGERELQAACRRARVLARRGLPLKINSTTKTVLKRFMGGEDPVPLLEAVYRKELKLLCDPMVTIVYHHGMWQPLKDNVEAKKKRRWRAKVRRRNGETEHSRVEKLDLWEKMLSELPKEALRARMDHARRNGGEWNIHMI